MIIESSEKIEIVQSFDELNLREELLRGVYAYGFDKPSAVQKRAILPIIRKRDGCIGTIYIIVILLNFYYNFIVNIVYILNSVCIIF